MLDSEKKTLTFKKNLFVDSGIRNSFPKSDFLMNFVPIDRCQSIACLCISKQRMKRVESCSLFVTRIFFSL